jgi:hypothetical protein
MASIHLQKVLDQDEIVTVTMVGGDPEKQSNSSFKNRKNSFGLNVHSLVRIRWNTRLKTIFGPFFWHSGHLRS